MSNGSERIPEFPTVAESVQCDNCHRERGSSDAEYSPIDLVFGRPPGWYSGDDGELCGECMSALFNRANGSGGNR